MKAVKDAEYLKFCSMLGSNIRYCRLKTGQPQKVLAAHIGVTFQNIQKYEVGKIIPSAFRLKVIADFFKVKADDLLDPSFIHRSTVGNEILDAAPIMEAVNGNLQS